jgi:hypothetical protein
MLCSLFDAERHLLGCRIKLQSQAAKAKSLEPMLMLWLAGILGQKSGAIEAKTLSFSVLAQIDHCRWNLWIPLISNAGISPVLAT